MQMANGRLGYSTLNPLHMYPNKDRACGLWIVDLRGDPARAVVHGVGGKRPHQVADEIAQVHVDR